MSDEKSLEMLSALDADTGDRETNAKEGREKEPPSSYEGRGVFQVRRICNILHGHQLTYGNKEIHQPTFDYQLRLHTPSVLGRSFPWFSTQFAKRGPGIIGVWQFICGHWGDNNCVVIGRNGLDVCDNASHQAGVHC